MKNILSLLLTILGLFFVTALAVLYSDGWRVDPLNGSINSENLVKKTGILAVRSIPDGAKIYLDEELKTATDTTISSLQPGKYKLRIEKEGFETWEKNITVFPELVTDITAILILQSPKLEPLTNTDVNAYNLSSNYNNIAFLTQNHQEPGIWELPLSNTQLNLFRNDTKILISDSQGWTPSLGESIWWSPDDKEILVKMNDSGYLLYSISNQNLKPPISVTDPTDIFARWDKEWRTEFLETKLETISDSQEIPEEILQAANTQETTWSPDDEKFFFITENESIPESYDVVVYNSEDPLPVGEKRTSYPLSQIDPNMTSLYWYTDSYHLIMVEQVPGRDNFYTVSLIRIDGTNRTVIYTGELASNQAYTTPGGDKIIVLTSLKEGNSPNLYAIAIR